MEKNLSLVIAVLIIAVVAIAAVFALLPKMPAAAQITSVSTDKPLYHSNDLMVMTITVNSAGYSNGTIITVEGIKDLYGQTRLINDIPANLTPGPNTFTNDFRLPPCSKCAGLDPGSYPINVTLRKDQSVLSNTTVFVDLEQ